MYNRLNGMAANNGNIQRILRQSGFTKLYSLFTVQLANANQLIRTLC